MDGRGLRRDLKHVVGVLSDDRHLRKRNSLIRRGNSIRKCDWQYRVLLWIKKVEGSNPSSPANDMWYPTACSPTTYGQSVKRLTPLA